MAIFFTLSGYVIALSYSDWDWRECPAFNLIRLFFYRFARLYPAFFFSPSSPYCARLRCVTYRLQRPKAISCPVFFSGRRGCQSNMMAN
jgi:hypothetical protein